MIQTNLISAEAKAKRLKSARALTGLSRKQIEQNFNISENTLRQWENPFSKGNGLSEKGAARITEMLKKAGIICTIEWLLYGHGEGPKTYNDVQNNITTQLEKIFITPEIEWNDEIIFGELESFRNLNPDPIAIRITDDSMEPFLHAGDYVAGNRKYGSDIEKYVGLVCIIETIDCLQLCRRLDKDAHNKLVLSCLNPSTRADQPVRYGVKCHSVAQVVWIRKIEKPL